MTTDARPRGCSRTFTAVFFLASACAAEASGATREEPVAAAAPAGAPTASAPRVAGRYRYAGGEPQRQQLLDAIEAVVSDMNFVARPIARRRLRDGNLPSEELQLVVTDAKITVLRPGRPTVSAPRDGSASAWTSPDGDTFTVRHSLRGDREVTQEFVGDGNRSVNVFTLAADGAQLTVHTTITADRLPSALRFRMTYQRQPG